MEKRMETNGEAEKFERQVKFSPLIFLPLDARRRIKIIVFLIRLQFHYRPLKNRFACDRMFSDARKAQRANERSRKQNSKSQIE